MATLKILDSDGAVRYLEVDGAGTLGDPHRAKHVEASAAAALTELTAIKGSVASPPLPTGAATAAAQATGNTSLGTIATALAAQATLVQTQPVSAAALPLPTGAATSAAQTTGNNALGAAADAEATGNGSIIAILKRLRTLIAGFLTVKLYDNNDAAISNANPLQVQQAQLTAANDTVAANAYQMRAGVWEPRKVPNVAAPHLNASLANNATSIVVTTGQVGSAAFRLYQFTITTTIAGAYSLWNGTPSGTTNLLARLNLAANVPFVFNYEGVPLVTAGNGMLIRNDAGATASITVHSNVATE